VETLFGSGAHEGRPDGPSPLTLLPAARSPSSRPYGTRLVGSYPTVSPLAPGGGRSALCCGCSHPRIAQRAPPLAFSWGGLPPATRAGVGKFLPTDRSPRGGGLPASWEYSSTQDGECQRHVMRELAQRFGVGEWQAQGLVGGAAPGVGGAGRWGGVVIGVGRIWGRGLRSGSGGSAQQ